jgi:hypothetical protein
MRFSEIAPVLFVLALAEAASEPFDLDVAGDELGISDSDLRHRLHDVETHGLAHADGEDGLHPTLHTAGRQYLALRGDIDDSVLRFLPNVIDDLHARRALLRGGVVLVDGFRTAVLREGAVEYARDIVPPAFAPVVDERLALDLFAAAVALLARLSDGRPTGCVAEEIVAIALLQEARAWLEMEYRMNVIDQQSMHAATAELRGLFELFRDHHTLDMYDMREPADAAVARFSDRAQEMGIADQTVEHWFDPFGWTAPTGYLSDGADTEPPPGRRH